MLVLSRKRDEQLQIGEQITVTVLKIKGDRVQLGIEAPRHVRVLRNELTVPRPDETGEESAKREVRSSKIKRDHSGSDAGELKSRREYPEAVRRGCSSLQTMAVAAHSGRQTAQLV